MAGPRVHHPQRPPDSRRLFAKRGRRPRLTDSLFLIRVEKSLARATLFCRLPRLGGRSIGRTSDSGSDYPGSSPGLPANLFLYPISDSDRNRIRFVGPIAHPIAREPTMENSQRAEGAKDARRGVPQRHWALWTAGSARNRR